MKRKKRRSPATIRELQREIGRLQQENDDLRRQVKEQAGLIDRLEQHYQGLLAERSAEVSQLQTLVDAGIQIPRLRG